MKHRQDQKHLKILILQALQQPLEKKKYSHWTVRMNELQSLHSHSPRVSGCDLQVVCFLSLMEQCLFVALHVFAAWIPSDKHHRDVPSGKLPTSPRQVRNQSFHFLTAQALR